MRDKLAYLLLAVLSLSARTSAEGLYAEGFIRSTEWTLHSGELRDEFAHIHLIDTNGNGRAFAELNGSQETGDANYSARLVFGMFATSDELDYTQIGLVTRLNSFPESDYRLETTIDMDGYLALTEWDRNRATTIAELSTPLKPLSSSIILRVSILDEYVSVSAAQADQLITLDGTLNSINNGGIGLTTLTTGSTEGVFSTLDVRPTGDTSGDLLVDASDVDLISDVIANPNILQEKLREWLDVNLDGVIDVADRTFWVNEIADTYYGDANLDGEFNSSDFVAVFSAGKYESELAANWSSGDWNGDGVFDSVDFVTAFQDGGYEQGPRGAARAVPEPTGLLGLIAALTGVAIYRRR